MNEITLKTHSLSVLLDVGIGNKCHAVLSKDDMKLTNLADVSAFTDSLTYSKGNSKGDR